MGENYERLEIALGRALSLRADTHSGERTAAAQFSLSLYGLPTDVRKCVLAHISHPSDGFEVTKGEPVIGGIARSHASLFLSRCMSWMFTRPKGMNKFVNLRPSMLDEHRSLVPFIEVWTQEKLPWANTPAVHSYATQPAFADWPKFTNEVQHFLYKGCVGTELWTAFTVTTLHPCPASPSRIILRFGVDKIRLPSTEQESKPGRSRLDRTKQFRRAATY